MTKIKTGIDGLDNLLFGGLPSGRAHLVAGEPGTGKTTLCLQFLLEGANNGEKTMFITLDEKPRHIIADMKLLGWDIDEVLDNGCFQILDVTKYFDKAELSETSGININQIVEDVIGFVKKNKVTRLAVDPVAPLVFREKSVPEISEYIRRLIFALESIDNCTTLLSSYVPVGSNTVSQHGVEEFAASGIIVLKMTKVHNKMGRTLWVRKMRGSQIDMSEYSFDILAKRGIVLRQPV